MKKKDSIFKIAGKSYLLSSISSNSFLKARLWEEFLQLKEEKGVYIQLLLTDSEGKPKIMDLYLLPESPLPKNLNIDVLLISSRGWRKLTFTEVKRAKLKLDALQKRETPRI